MRIYGRCRALHSFRRCYGRWPRRVALELGHYRVDRMVVHRLDMATSGLVIMARSDAALKDLNRQVRLALFYAFSRRLYLYS